MLTLRSSTARCIRGRHGVAEIEGATGPVIRRRCTARPIIVIVRFCVGGGCARIRHSRRGLRRRQRTHDIVEVDSHGFIYYVEVVVDDVTAGVNVLALDQAVLGVVTC